jgi:hypothetical protein
MNVSLRDRILRKLDSLSDERGYQILDYADFLESRYAEKAPTPVSLLQRFSEGVEDRLRVGGVAAGTVAETMGLLNKAVGVLGGVAAAGMSVASDVASVGMAVAGEVGSTAQRIMTTPAAGAPAGAPPAGAPPAGAPPAGAAPVPPATPPGGPTPNGGAA